MARDLLASMMPKVPTVEGELRRALPPEMRSMMAGSAGAPGAERRRRPRITIDELNQRGVQAVREKWPELEGQRQGLRRSMDQRSTLEKVFDWIDVPRNLVAQVIGALAGVDTAKLPRGAMGIPRIRMEDVLEKLRVKPGIARAIVGFIGDVAIDPLTYLSAGALTGKAIARHVPRILPEGLKTIAGGLRTGRMPGIVAKALDAGVDISRMKPTAVAAQIAKNVTRGDEVGAAARAFYSHFGVKGRHLLRIPGTQIKTPALKFGKKAALHRAVSTVTPGQEASIRWAGRWFGGMRNERLTAALQGAQKAIHDRDVAKFAVSYKEGRSYLAELKRQYQMLAKASRSAAEKGVGEAARRMPIPQPAVRRLQREIDMAEGMLNWMREKAARLSSSKSWSKRDAQALRDLMRAGPFTGQAVTRGAEGKGLRVAKAAVEMPGARPFEQFPGRGAIGAKAKNLQELRQYMRGMRTYRQLPPELVAAKGQIGRVKVDLAGAQAAMGAAKQQSQAGMAALRKTARRMERMGGRYLQARAGLPDISRIAEEAERGKTFTGRIGQALQQKFGLGMTSPQRLEELRIQGRATLGASASARKTFQQFAKPVDALAAKFAALAGGDATKARALIYHALDIGGPDNLAKLHPQEVAWLRQNLPGLDQVWANPAFQQFKQRFDGAMAKLMGAEQGAGIGVGAAKDIGYAPRVLAPETRKAVGAQRVVTGQRMGVGGEAAQGFMAPRVRRYEIADAAGKVETILAQPAKVKGQVRAGWKLTGREWAVSAAEHERMLADPAQYQHLVGAGVDRAKLGTMFQTDPAKAAASRAFQHERAMAAAEMQQLVNATGVPVAEANNHLLQPAGYRVVKELSPDNPLYSIMGEAGPFSSKGRQMAYPRPVADALDRYRDLFKSDRDLDVLLRPLDWTMGWFKRWALFAPAYVTRNVFQNAFGTLMAGGPSAVAKQGRFALSPAAFAVFKAMGADDLGQLAGKTLRIGGRQVPLDEIAKEFIRYHGAMGVRGIADFTPEMLRGGGTLKTAGRAGGKYISAGADVIRRFNTAVEGHMRFGTYLAFLDEGLTSREAMMRTLLAMPDLGDVTRFERDVAARILPWYRWFRRNGALQLFHFLPQTPAWMAATGKLQNFIESASASWRQEPGTVPEELRPEWMREMQAPQVMGGPKQGSAFLLRSWFPFEEAQAAMSLPLGVDEAARWAASQARPGIKTIFELASGRDIFRQAPIKPFTMAEAIGAIGSGRAFAGASGTALDNLLAIRPIREVRRVAEQPTVAGKIGRVLGGGAMQALDAEKGRTALDYQTQQQLNELRTKIARAIENRDAVETRRLQDILRKFMALQQRRMELGLQVPRSTERQMTAAGLAPQPQHAGVGQ